MAAAATQPRGTTAFVKEVYLDNPLAPARDVNEAWDAAGRVGAISHTLVSQVRSRLELAGNSSGRRSQRVRADANERRGRGRSPEPTAPQADGTTRVKARGRERLLADLEAELDRLLLQVMDAGDLPEVEDALRKARRLLYAGSTMA